MLKISSTLAIVLLLFSCGENKSGNEKISSPRIRKETNVISPKQNLQIIRGSQINFEISTSDGNPIDSILVSIGNEDSIFYETNFSISLPNRKVGAWKLKTTAFFAGKSETHYPKVIVLPENAPEELTYEVVNSYPHDTDDYTQGLLINDGFLYESTGQKGESALKKKNLNSGETLQAVNLSDDLFGEGLALLNDEFYQLTWKARKGFVYNIQMEQIRTFTYQTEGWGLTNYGNQLLMTSGDEKILFIEPLSFTVSDEIEVYDNNEKIDSLNEMEVIDGLIYANVWLKDYIVVIDPETGEVLKNIDFSGLLSKDEKDDVDVLNGIAYDKVTNRIFVTGKYWPKLFEVKLIPKNATL
jgi:glutaminyl-peptide cyclotransferase